MAFVEQSAVLNHMQAMHGKSAFTMHHINYKLVGYKVGARKVYAVGSTWEEAIYVLERKIR